MSDPRVAGGTRPRTPSGDHGARVPYSPIADAHHVGATTVPYHSQPGVAQPVGAPWRMYEAGTDRGIA